MGRLFGTDGIRGAAGVWPLDDSTVARIGAAIVAAMTTEDSEGARVLLGRDTRESGPEIERALARGIRAAGGDVVSAGVVPTPAIAYLTAHMGFSAGIVVSASHNPFQDNGIKVFAGDGTKAGDRIEGAIEIAVADGAPVGEPPADVPVRLVDYREAYIAHLHAIVSNGPPLRRFRVAVDCANGATSTVAALVFAGLGIAARVIADEPDGRNINRACGSTAPARLASAVVEGGCDLGIAYDGDGDRVIFVDAAGAIVDGDAVLYMSAKYLHAERALAQDAVVATVMSNIGLELALGDAGISLVRCPVGDRNVVKAMQRRGLSLGGEQSGHVIFSDDLWTGDGIGTSLHVLQTMTAMGKSLGELAAELVTLPQVLLNLRVERKVDLSTLPEVTDVISRAEELLEGRGRLLVRYSGTEPLLRVMLEGEDRGEIRRLGAEIIEAVRVHVGAVAEDSAETIT